MERSEQIMRRKEKAMKKRNADKTITVDILRRNDACHWGIKRFEKTFGKSAKVSQIITYTLDNLDNQHTRGYFPYTDWILEYFYIKTTKECMKELGDDILLYNGDAEDDINEFRYLCIDRYQFLKLILKKIGIEYDKDNKRLRKLQLIGME